MTVYELMHELRKIPEDAEIIIYSRTENWQYVIDDNDNDTFSLEHTQENEPILFIATE